MPDENKEEVINYYIDPSCDIRGIDRIEIGNNVVIQKDCCLNIEYNNPNNRFMIQIGDGSNLERRCNISASNKIVIGKKVLISSNVLITDQAYEYRDISIPAFSQRIIPSQNEVIIGDGTWVCMNSVIEGNVHIGKGCVIRENTVIKSNIPDYCVVFGCPAMIIEILDLESNVWVSVETELQRSTFLDKRKKASPLISICIPTYNRARDLETCLNTIFNQIGEDSCFEINVLDNASTDNTENVVGSFAAKYPNLKYYKNESNIGGDPNIYKSISLASGEYVFMHGDDDFFREGTLYPILNIIKQNRHLSLFFLNALSGNGQTSFSSGMDNYLKDTSIYAGFISSIIFKKSEFDKLEDSRRFIDKSFNQIYIQYSILSSCKEYCIINYAAFWHPNNPPLGYSFAKVFIKNYIDILMFFIDKGLSQEAIKADKQRILGCMIYPWYKRILDNNLSLDLNDFNEIFTEYYKDEPYYLEASSVIESIRADRRKE